MPTPTNNQGYEGGYELMFGSLDGKGYSSSEPPINAGGNYCFIMISDTSDYYISGSRAEIVFTFYPEDYVW